MVTMTAFAFLLQMMKLFVLVQHRTYQHPLRSGIIPNISENVRLSTHFITLIRYTIMFTISKDYLESLPDDKRKTFLNNVNSMRNMTPSAREELLTNQFRELYADHKGRIIKCSFCRKDEPDGNKEFGGKWKWNTSSRSRPRRRRKYPCQYFI